MFNLLVAFSGWTPPSGQMSLDRMLLQTDPTIAAQMRDVHGAPDLTKLAQLPTLFMPEVQNTGHAPFAKVGRILSLNSQGRNCVISFQFDERYPAVPLADLLRMEAELGLSGFKLNTTHWAVKNGDLSDLLLRCVSAAGRTAGQYHIHEELGRGACGVVHRAERSVSGVTFQCALKTFLPSPFIADKNVARQRFFREIQALLTVQHHAVVSAIDAGMTDAGDPYLVMPLVQGTDLRTATTRMDWAKRAALFDIVLEGVAQAHRCNVLHRDLKPSNILVRNADLHPQILDFGAAYLWDIIDEQSLTHSALGSPGYIPFEVFSNPKLRSVQHDVFSLGVILYEIYKGSKPAPTAAEYQSLAQVAPELAILDPVVKAAVAPADVRIPTVEEFRQQFGAVLARM